MKCGVGTSQMQGAAYKHNNLIWASYSERVNSSCQRRISMQRKMVNAALNDIVNLKKDMSLQWTTDEHGNQCCDFRAFSILQNRLLKARYSLRKAENKIRKLRKKIRDCK